MSVTPDVSHVEMWPYVASASALSETHDVRAALMPSSSSALPATTSNKLTAHRSAAGLIIVAQGQLYHARRDPESSAISRAILRLTLGVVRATFGFAEKKARGPVGALALTPPGRFALVGPRGHAAQRSAR